MNVARCGPQVVVPRRLARGFGYIAVAIAVVPRLRLPCGPRLRAGMPIIVAVPLERPLKRHEKLSHVLPELLEGRVGMLRKEPSCRTVEKCYADFAAGTPQEKLAFIVTHVTTWPVLVQRVMEKVHAAVAARKKQLRRDSRTQSSAGQLAAQRARMAALRARRRVRPVG